MLAVDDRIIGEVTDNEPQKFFILSSNLLGGEPTFAKKLPHPFRAFSLENDMKVNCDQCGREFLTSLQQQRRNRHNFCSRNCLYEYQNKSIKTSCDQCGKKITVRPCYFKKSKNHFCSQGCLGKYREVSIKINCDYCGKEKRIWPSCFRDGKHHFCSKECVDSYFTRERSPNWKGGITPKNEKMRQSKRYKTWRISVFERDNYTCQRCGCRSGNSKAIYLEVHHIKPFGKYQRGRYDTENGITLCKKCHRHAHTLFGNKINPRAREIGQKVLSL